MDSGRGKPKVLDACSLARFPKEPRVYDCTSIHWTCLNGQVPDDMAIAIKDAVEHRPPLGRPSEYRLMVHPPCHIQITFHAEMAAPQIRLMCQAIELPSRDDGIR